MSAQSKKRPPTAPASQRSLLVVDDDPPFCELLEEVFTLDGWEVRVAHDGVEGLRLCRERRPAIVILDIFLPKMDGFEVLTALHQRDPGLPVVVLSASASILPETRALAETLGAVLTFAKPLDLAALVRVVAELAIADPPS